MVKTKGTREWSKSSVNCLLGCFRNCRYCYAKNIANRFNRIKKEDWKNMKLNEKMRDKRFKKRSGRVMFPTSHDIPDPTDPKYLIHFKFTMYILENLLNAGNEVLITTKPNLETIKYICLNFNKYKDQIKFRFTITSTNNITLKYWEIESPRFEERLECLKYTFKINFKNSVSIEPCLMLDPGFVIKKIKNFVNGNIWIGIMNFIPKSDITKQRYKEIKKINENNNLKDWIEKYSNIPNIRFKDAILNKIKDEK